MDCVNFYSLFNNIWSLLVSNSVCQYSTIYYRVCKECLLRLCSTINNFRLITLLYVQEGDVDKFYRHCAGNPLTSSSIADGGLTEVFNYNFCITDYSCSLQVVKKLSNPKKELKYDNRVTGSDIIDSSLQEILGYIIRDYIIPWYNLISLDKEFPQKTVKKTAQSLAINISNR